MKTHPAARIFPLLEGSELDELTEDIRTNGLLEPIETLDGSVLDGRNRLTACGRAHVVPKFREVRLGGTSPVAYVIAKNLHRRHLTPTQRAAVATAALPMLEAEAKERMAAGGRGRLDTNTQPSPASEVAGKAFGVGSSYVKRAKRVGRESPELLEKMKHGTTTLSEAERSIGVFRKDRPVSKNGLPIGQTKRSSIPSRMARLRGVVDALTGYAEALPHLDLRGEEVDELLGQIAEQAGAIRRAAKRLMEEGVAV